MFSGKFSGTRPLAAQLRRVLLLCSLILLCLSAPAHAQLWSGIIDPSRAVDWNQAGIPGGIPNRTTVCATLDPGATAAQINSAIAACPSGQVVFLNAGTYNLSGAIIIAKSNVTLRGAGPDQTKLVFSSGGGCGNTTAVVCVSGSGQWSGGPDNLTAWTAGYAQGTTVITLASVTNLAVGQVLILDQLDDASDPGTVYVCGTLSCSSEGQAAGGGRGGNHAQMQFAEVKAITTTTRQVTISPGLYMPNWRASQSPSAWWANTLAQNVGIENLLLDNRTAGAGSITVFNNAYKSWVKNIASIGGGSRSHVDQQYSANLVVRDSFFWGASGANLSYGIETWMSGNTLVENNIFQHVTTPLLLGAGAGSVYSYNYATDEYSTNPAWLYPAAMEHDPGTSMNLYEGNIVPSMMQDSIHGTHNFGTYFRNRLSGVDGVQTSQTVPLLLESYSRYANIVGNVLGTSGYHNKYQTNQGGSTTNCNTSIYNMGWGGTVCSAGVGNDAITVNTVMRWGNYDTVTGAPQWNVSEVPSSLSLYGTAVPADHTLPASFYLSATPSFWGTMPWPPIGPDVSGGDIPGVGGHAYLIPAQLCYNNSAKDANGILIFNANICYNTALDTTPPAVSLTAPANGVTVSGTAVTVSASASDNVGVVGVQFKLDGVNLGAEDTVAPYSVSWNTTLAASGTHSLTAVARDAAGNTATAAAVGVTVDNTTPVISTVTASSISSAGALITWATNEAGDSQVDYGPTTAYGSSTPLNASLLTAHAVTLSGLLASTTYHYRVKSHDAAGNLATSADFTLTTLVGAPTITSFTPTSGPVGTNVTISGTNFTGATVVMFNGVSAAPFSVTSATAIQDTVPTGATTGPLSVTTPGGTATSTSVFTVTNTGPDTTPPSVSITAPANGATVSGSVTVSASATDNMGVVGVQFQLDGASLGAEITSVPYTLSWNTAIASNGLHTLAAVARDAAGNTATAAVMSVTVNNVGTTTLPLYFQFDESSGTTATDSSGNSNNGVLFNSPVFAAGRMGNAVSLNGVNQYVQVSSTTGLNLSNAITLAAWINPADLSSYRNVIIKGAAGSRGFGMNIISGALNFVNVGGADFTSTVTLSTNAWQHIAITWNAITGEVKFYKNGTLAQTIISSSAVIAPTDTDVLVVGRWLGGTSYFGGLIDDLRIYNGVLAASDILALYNAAPNDTSPPAVSITAPAVGATVAGTVTVSASTTDNVGVVGVQLQLDGANLGAEVTAAPYALSWNTATASNGAHTLTAIARDAAGNTATSTAVAITVDNAAPVLSAVSNSSLGASAATITWATDEASDSQVEYGLTTAYGSTTVLNASLITAHSQVLSSLAAGTLYHYRVKSRDAVGNLAVSGDVTFTTLAPPDTTPPTVSITAPAAGATVSGTITVSASATDNVGAVGVQFKLDGVNLGAEVTSAPYTLSWNTATASNGLHTLTAVARDAAGNTATTAAVSVTVDNAPPVISSMSTSGITASSATISWTTDEASDSQVEYGTTSAYGQVSALASALVSSHSVGLSGLSASTMYHYRVKSRDAVGNLAVSGDVTFTTLAPPDTTPPTVSITAPAASATVAGTVTVSASATDNVGVVGVQFKLDGANLGAEVTAAPYSLSWNTTLVASGSHSLTAVARDAAGNTATTAAVSATVDNAPPVISSMSASGITASSATISWTTDETSDSQVEYGTTTAYGSVTALNASLVTAHSQALSGLLASTVYHYRVKSRDAAGNLAVAADVTFTTAAPPDTTLPTVAIIAPAAGATVAGTVTVSASATDNVGVVGVQFKLDGVNLGAEVLAAPYALSWTTTAASNGSHSLTTVARDAAGNTATSAAVSVTVDNASPVISSMSASGITPSSATISWTTDEASDSQVEYGTSTADGSVTALNASLVTAHSQALSGLSASTVYHYRVKSRDAVGNLAVSGDVTFTTLAPPDTTPPTVSLTAPATGSTVAGTITVSASATDNVGVVGVQFKLDGVNLGAEVTAAPYALSWTTTLAANGAHSLTALARDAAGNTATSTAVAVTVDNAAPVLSAVSSSSVGPSSATITWTTDEASDSQVEYGLTTAYGSSTVLNASLVTAHSQALSSLVAGTLYHYRVKSRDAAGNLATSADVTFTTAAPPDTMPPAVSITAPTAGATVVGTVTVSATASDNVGVVGVQFKLDGVNLGAELTTAPYALSWNTPLAPNGTHSLTAVARDAAGNTAPSSAVSVTVDNAPPLLSSVASTSLSSSAATITWTTDEASDSQVEYGLTTAYGSSTVLNASLVTAHSQALSGLSASTVYHYRVKSRDAVGNLAVSGDGTFTTLAPPDTTPPTVSLTAPAAGATVAGTITVSASATDNVGVVGVQFKLDGVNLGAEITAAPYSLSWNTTGATNGSHSLTALARDAAGNTAPSSAVSVTVDNVAPVISAVSSASVGSSSATISWTTDEASDSQVEYGLTTAYGSSTVLNASLVTAHSQALSSLVAGTLYHYRVKSRDAAGNLATSADVTFTTAAPPDTTPPTVSMTAPAAGATVAGTITVSASATDNVGVVGVQFKLDGVNLGAEVTAVPYSLSWNTTLVASGSHSLTAVARDAAGNTATSTAVAITVDNAAPVLSAVSSSSVGPSSATISWTTDEASDSQVEYGSTSGYGQVSTLASALVTSHSVGLNGLSASTVYHYRVKSRDAVGNLAVSGDITFMTLAPPDTTPPTVSLTAPATGSTVAGTITVSASATDNVGVVGVQFKLDGANLGAELTTAPYAILWATIAASNGTHSLTAVARDAAGNTAPASAVSVTVDNTAPVLSAMSSSSVGPSAATITWATDEPSDSQVEYGTTTAYGSVTALNASFVTAHAQALNGLLASTVYHYRVKSRDAAGNLATSVDVTFTTAAPPDTTPPTVSITAPAAGATVSGTITVSASATDNVGVVGVQFKLDGANLGAEVTAAPYTLSWITTTAANGVHSVTAVARDAAGNTAPAGAVSVTVDNAPPLLSSVASTSISSSAATITWATDEASDSQVEYGLTSAYGQVTALTSALVSSHSVGLSGLSASTLYHYRVKSRDAAGNLATSTDVTFTTAAPLGDTAPPTVSITGPANGATVAGTVTVSASATDNVGVVGVQFKLDGVNLGAEITKAPYTLAWITSTASQGKHTLTAVARDAAGNTATSSSVTVTVTSFAF